MMNYSNNLELANSLLVVNQNGNNDDNKKTLLTVCSENLKSAEKVESPTSLESSPTALLPQLSFTAASPTTTAIHNNVFVRVACEEEEEEELKKEENEEAEKEKRTEIAENPELSFTAASPATTSIQNNVFVRVAYEEEEAWQKEEEQKQKEQEETIPITETTITKRLEKPLLAISAEILQQKQQEQLYSRTRKTTPSNNSRGGSRKSSRQSKRNKKLQQEQQQQQQQNQNINTNNLQLNLLLSVAAENLSNVYSNFPNFNNKQQQAATSNKQMKNVDVEEDKKPQQQQQQKIKEQKQKQEEKEKEETVNLQQLIEKKQSEKESNLSVAANILQQKQEKQTTTTTTTNNETSSLLLRLCSSLLPFKQKEQEDSSSTTMKDQNKKKKKTSPLVSRNSPTRTYVVAQEALPADQTYWQSSKCAESNPWQEGRILPLSPRLPKEPKNQQLQFQQQQQPEQQQQQHQLAIISSSVDNTRPTFGHNQNMFIEEKHAGTALIQLPTDFDSSADMYDHEQSSSRTKQVDIKGSVDISTSHTGFKPNNMALGTRFIPKQRNNNMYSRQLAARAAASRNNGVPYNTSSKILAPNVAQRDVSSTTNLLQQQNYQQHHQHFHQQKQQKEFTSRKLTREEQDEEKILNPLGNFVKLPQQKQTSPNSTLGIANKSRNIQGRRKQPEIFHVDENEKNPHAQLPDNLEDQATKLLVTHSNASPNRSSNTTNVAGGGNNNNTVSDDDEMYEHEENDENFYKNENSPLQISNKKMVQKEVNEHRLAIISPRKGGPELNSDSAPVVVVKSGSPGTMIDNSSNVLDVENNSYCNRQHQQKNASSTEYKSFSHQLLPQEMQVNSSIPPMIRAVAEEARNRDIVVYESYDKNFAERKLTRLAKNGKDVVNEFGFSGSGSEKNKNNSPATSSRLYKQVSKPPPGFSSTEDAILQLAKQHDARGTASEMRSMDSLLGIAVSHRKLQTSNRNLARAMKPVVPRSIPPPSSHSHSDAAAASDVDNNNNSPSQQQNLNVTNNFTTRPLYPSAIKTETPSEWVSKNGVQTILKRAQKDLIEKDKMEQKSGQLVLVENLTARQQIQKQQQQLQLQLLPVVVSKSARNTSQIMQTRQQQHKVFVGDRLIGYSSSNAAATSPQQQQNQQQEVFSLTPHVNLSHSSGSDNNESNNSPTNNNNIGSSDVNYAKPHLPHAPNDTPQKFAEMMKLRLERATKEAHPLF